MHGTLANISSSKCARKQSLAVIAEPIIAFVTCGNACAINAHKCGFRSIAHTVMCSNVNCIWWKRLISTERDCWGAGRCGRTPLCVCVRARSTAVAQLERKLWNRSEKNSVPRRCILLETAYGRLLRCRLEWLHCEVNVLHKNTIQCLAAPDGTQLTWFLFSLTD